MRVSTSLPPELQQSAPRDVRLTNGGKTLVIVTWLLVAGALAAGTALYAEATRQSNAALDMNRRGVAVPAVVDRVWRKSGDGNPGYAAFHFDANGARIDGQSRMQMTVWRGLHAGSTLRVRYLPEDPRRWIVDGARRNRLPFAVAYIVWSVSAALALGSAIAVRQQRTLLSEGRSARATVTEVKKHRGSHGEEHTTIVYEFPLFGGGTTTGKAVVSKPGPVGTAINVLYDSEQPKRNRPYPFSLVTIDREF